MAAGSPATSRSGSCSLAWAAAATARTMPWQESPRWAGAPLEEGGEEEVAAAAAGAVVEEEAAAREEGAALLPQTPAVKMGAATAMDAARAAAKVVAVAMVVTVAVAITISSRCMECTAEAAVPWVEQMRCPLCLMG